MSHGPSTVVGKLEAVTPAAPVPTDAVGRWYVAHTRSRNEKILAVEFTRLGVFHYLPLTLRITRSPVTRRISRSMVPVFPGYVFFHGDEEHRYRALRTNRIAHVLDVPNQEQLAMELLNIHAMLTSKEDFAVATRLTVGDWVRIIAGPLRGVEGVIARTSGRWRLHLNVTTLGQSVNVEVDTHSVERIDPPDYAFVDINSRLGRV